MHAAAEPEQHAASETAAGQTKTAMLYLTFKAIHVIGFVSWFAGLLYIVRLFIYHREAWDRPAAEQKALQQQLLVMQRRLWYGITWPAGILTWAAGVTLATLGGYWLAPWLHIKLTLLVLLSAYHIQCGRLHRQQRAGQRSWSSMALRIWNEVATLLLVAIVFLGVFKHALLTSTALLWLAAVAALLAGGIAIYAWSRRRKKSGPPVAS